MLKVLGELGVSAEKTPIIEVWNKIDLLGADDDARRETLRHVAPAGTVAATVPVSAETGEGIDALLDAIETALAGQEPDLPRARAACERRRRRLALRPRRDHRHATSRTRRARPTRSASIRGSATAFTQRFAGRIEADG